MNNIPAPNCAVS